MKNNFLSQKHLQEAFLGYYNISHISMLLLEAIHEFDRLWMWCDVAEEEEQVTA